LGETEAFFWIDALFGLRSFPVIGNQKSFKEERKFEAI
jgi:hypothetical protein